MEKIRAAVVGFGGMGRQYVQMIYDGEIDGMVLARHRPGRDAESPEQGIQDRKAYPLLPPVDFHRILIKVNDLPFKFQLPFQTFDLLAHVLLLLFCFLIM